MPGLGPRIPGAPDERPGQSRQQCLPADSEWRVPGLAAGSASHRSLLYVFSRGNRDCFCSGLLRLACTRSWPAV